MAHEVVLTETLVETLEQFETEDAERIINKLEDIGDFPGHVLDWLKNQLQASHRRLPRADRLGQGQRDDIRD